EYLNEVGLLSPRSVLAHCVWPSESEIDLLARSGVKVSHCPSSNLKLGSGVAPVPELIERGICVSLGADGAACNNRLDMFTEMRTAALLQKPIHGPESIPALTALRMATIEGARALGLDSEIGSIEVGKRADLQLINLDRVHTTPHNDLVSAIVYSATAADVATVLVDGNLIMQDRKLLTLDEDDILKRAEREAERLSSVRN
ncbi:MAG TPA: amidohydrolase family protein, partial [Blastocatellia bacterium]|nr:amidohydrolase family protein [Blastocatellia bacterium]